MRLYLFSTSSEKQNISKYRQLLHRIADQTDTSDLVVVLYLEPGRFRTRGTAYVRRWMRPGQFLPSHGNWKGVRLFGIPADLPDRYKLIRLRLEGKRSCYPLTETDIYGWECLYPDFETHLAHLFAHELHHFRRYHLGLHPGEGEHSANQWALHHIQTLGYTVKNRRIRKRQKRKASARDTLFKKLVGDPYTRFRNLKENDTVHIMKDPRNKYAGQSARVLRPIRTNSKRLVIQTSDGKSWRWPMNWLDPVEPETKN